MTQVRGKLFLIPSPINEGGLAAISEEVRGIIRSLDYFIVERARTSRRFVSSLKHPQPIDSLTFEEMPGEGLTMEEKDISRLLEPLKKGRNIGLMSEAGLPAIADPGNLFVKKCQETGFQVVPLSGPSSLMMALMASGLEGQRFAFHGYLSAKKEVLQQELKELEKRADRDKATQIFIEAPYRNRQVMEVAEKVLDKNRLFCIAADIGGPDGSVITKTILKWKTSGWPEIHKVPAVFLIG